MNQLTKRKKELEKENKKSEDCVLCKQLQEGFEADCGKHIGTKAELRGIRFAETEIKKKIKKNIK